MDPSTVASRRNTLWLPSGVLALLTVAGLGSVSFSEEPKPESPKNGSESKPQSPRREVSPDDLTPEGNPDFRVKPLVLSKLYNSSAKSLHNENGTLSGRVVLDGLPFEVGGTLRLYGETQHERDDEKPQSIKGLRVRRKFQSLYLIHYATWPDAEGRPTCYVCLNYEDDTEAILPVCYGVHLRDWYNLPSYEKEAVSDPNTTICWRGEPQKYKAPMRLFKSKFANPSPEKVVTTIDFVSARNLSGYNVVAASVGEDIKGRSEKVFRDRKFDGMLRIHVVDDSTGRPIEGALVYPSMNVSDEGVVGSPFYTSSAGSGTIPFPTKDTSNMYATVKKEGYSPASQSWNSPSSGSFTFRLTPASNADPQ